jgi:glycosyltransferase involved in cell wall biosynthesis
MLSAIVIAQNEEAYLADCLDSLRGLADEIVVLDGGSTDRTVAIAEARGARVQFRPFDDFGKQKQAALDFAMGDWVLSIDADERLTPALAKEIAEAIRDPDAREGYEIRREQIYLGKRLRFGGTQDDWVLRLARRSAARFSDATVHERMLVEGRSGRLRATMQHLKYRSLAEHVQTIDHYTTLLARDSYAQGRRFSRLHLLRIPGEIWSRLVLRGGVLDGRMGVIYAAMSAFYAFLKYAKLADPSMERRRNPDGRGGG